MSKADYEVTKLLKVSIDKIVPNTWNAKSDPKDNPEYQKVFDSIKTKGLRGAIVVREHPHQDGYYEIIDGRHRYEAAKELGYREMWVYNEGQVDEKEAKELTIWFQVQVPFRRDLEAMLVSSMADEFGIENLELPYTEEQYKEFSDLANFSFENYKDEEFKENTDGTVTFSIKLAKTDYEIVKGTLEKIIQDTPYEVDIAGALIQLCTDYSVDKSE